MPVPRGPSPTNLPHHRIANVTPVLAAALALAAAPLGAAEAKPGAAPAGKAGKAASPRKAVDLTVYNADLALVREERTLSLSKGANRVAVPDVPSTIEPTSVHFASLTDPSGVRVVEQNYQYDLVNRAKLLEKYVGRTVEFARVDASGRETTVQGRLLAVEAAPRPAPEWGGPVPPPASPGIIAEIGGKVEVDPAGRLVLPGLPEGLILKPQLEWHLSAGKDGEHKAQVSYLATGLSWACDYVILLGKDDDRVDLKGWVTLVNNSGTAFKDAGLKLVAGDVNRVRDEMREARVAKLAMADAAPEQFQQKELFEYKLYALQRRTDLADNESKQIELVTAKDVPARKALIYDGLEDGWRWWLHNPEYRAQGAMGQQGNPKVGVYLVLRNEAKGGMGMPLPKGRARVYKRDDDGKEQFIGEDRIDHTPRDEEIRLSLGNAFDVVGSRAQTDFRTISSGKVVEESFTITLRNHKKTPVDVDVYEHPWRWSQWEVVKSSVPGEKVDQTTLKFPLKVPAGQEKTVTYTVRYSW